jgi:peptidoglycan/xylan/chitin deacetylase (PgdA/CDA1 family)
MKAGAVVAGLLGAALPALPALTFVTPVRALLPRLRGIGSDHHIALTFDDGPDPRSTPHFLDLLRERGVHATFFMVGEQLSHNRRLGKEIAAAGHEIAVHGWHHRNVLTRGSAAVYDDIASAHDLIADVTGTQPRWYRPPYGVLSWPALSAAQRLGMTPVLWTAWGRDWTARATPASVFQTTARGLRGGATILLHDSDRYAAVGSWRATLGAVALLLDECERRQLSPGPLRTHGLESNQ